RHECCRGFELAPGVFVPVEEAELAGLRPRRNGAIELLRFVPAQAGDPLDFAPAYYLEPARAAVPRRPYALPLLALSGRRLARPGRFADHGRQQLCLVRPLGESLLLQTLYFRDEVRPAAAITAAVAEVELDPAEVAACGQLLGALAVPFKPEALASEQRRRLR